MAAGIDRAYAGRVERGQENVTIAVIASIADALSVPLVELFVMPAAGETLPRPLRPGRKAKTINQDA